MESLFNAVKCLECGGEVNFSLFPGTCPHCGSAWVDAQYDTAGLPKNWTDLIATRSTNLWRFQELLPFSGEISPVSMGEGWTPLTRAEGLQKELDHPEIWMKDERQQPTGSFKDRQAAAAVTVLKSKGIMDMVLASTGNAAAAYAAYCARAGIKLWVFLTSSVPAEKMRELALYGAEVIKITGTYDQAKKVAADFAARREFYYDTGAKAIPDKEIMKTIAFEITEQLGWRAPDWYIQAVSGGLGPIGVLKGFEELKAAGITNKVPKIGVVQVEGCSPMVQAWEQGLDEAEPVTPDTLIHVLSTGSPGFAYKILNSAIARFGGGMVAVSDGDAFRSMRKVARLEGFSVEPATSVAFAGLEKMLEKGVIQLDETVVVNCSGHTFSAEKHALEDRYVVDLDMGMAGENGAGSHDGLGRALEQLDEKVTTIVIIDDNPQDSRLIRKLLHRYKNYRIFEAHNGEDGVDLARQRRPDLIMLDLTMPEMDGFSILNELKKDPRTQDIPVMIVSGMDLTFDQQEYLDQNAETVLQKGNFSGKELVDQVLEMLGNDELRPAESAPEVEIKIEDHDLEPELVNDFGNQDRPQVLIVDDNQWDTRLMRRLIEARQKFEAVEAYSVKQALDIIAFKTPDLVLLDILMPEADGKELLRAMRQNKVTELVPVIVVSAKELTLEERNYFSSQEVDSIWSKGMLDRNSLLAHVEDILTE